MSEVRCRKQVCLSLGLAMLFCACTFAERSFAAELKVGDEAPDFTATGIDGKDVTLSKYLKRTGKPAVLVFSRAHWCPFCMGQLAKLRKHEEQLEKFGANVMLVFREEKLGVEGLKKIKEKNPCDFTLVSDYGAKATAGYSTGGFTTYVVDQDGVIRAVLEGTKTNRPTAEKIVAAVEDVAKTE